jgi:hypothetical protein
VFLDGGRRGWGNVRAGLLDGPVLPLLVWAGSIRPRINLGLKYNGPNNARNGGAIVRHMEPVTSIFLFPVSAVYGANVYGWLDSLAYGTDGTWHVTVTGAGLAWLTSLVTVK